MTFNLSGTDFATWFYPYSQSPLTFSGGHYPPWTYLLTYPFSLSSIPAGYLLLILFSLLIIHLNTRSIPRTLLCALSLPVALSLTLGNIDSLLSTAFLLPFSLSGLIVVCKPQALVVYWMRKWATHRRLWGPLFVILALTLSLLIWKGWFLHLTGSALATNFLISRYWPRSLLLGVPLLLTQSPTLWMIGGILCTPYLQFYHLTPIVIYVISRKSLPVDIGIMAASWIIGVATWG